MVKQDVIARRNCVDTQEAAECAGRAAKFCSTLMMSTGIHWIDAKSKLGIMRLLITEGSNVMLWADGVDEINAIRSLVTFLESGSSSIL